MKRLALFFALISPAFGQLSVLTAWEVRPGVGLDTNGGCYVTGSSGTDYSQQNAAQYAFTDLASVSSLVVSSASHNFVAADVGNCINITAGTGFTPGVYQIVSVLANQATLDASPGTVGVGGTYAVGGALATPAFAYASAVSQNTIYGKQTGSYTVTSAQELSGQNAQPISFIGYKTTRGDGAASPGCGNCFTWTTATNSIDLMSISDASNYLFQNVIFSTTAGTPGLGFHANGSPNGTSGLIHLTNCSLRGFSVGISGLFSQQYAFTTIILENTEIETSVGKGVANDGATIIIGCYVHNNGDDGLYTDGSTGGVSGPFFVSHSIIKSNGGKGVNFNNTNNNGTNPSYIWPILLNNAIINNTSDGVAISVNQTGAPGSVVAWNNIIDSNGGYGINGIGTSPLGIGMISFRSNAYRANSSGALHQLPAGTGDVTLSADPFVNRAANNFALNSTSGGGAACKQAGFPGVLPVGGTGYIDIGPLQSQGGGPSSPSPVGFVAQ